MKSKGGLTRHTRTKHVSNNNSPQNQILEETLQISEVEDLMKQSQESLYKNKCYPEDIRLKIKDHTFKVNTSFMNQVQDIYKKLKKSGDAENFYINYYTNIILKASNFIENLQVPLCTLLTKNFGDKLFHYSKQKEVASEIPSTKAISLKELGALQYLAGYIVKKFITKMRNAKDCFTNDSQAVISLLESFVEDEIETQRLIASQSRGGLTAVKNELQQIFLITEERFRKETDSTTLVSKINIFTISDKLMKVNEVRSIYSALIEISGVKMENEIADNLLEKMLTLYLRVRSFTNAKDITSKHKIKSKKSRSKALRKDIKRSTEDSNKSKKCVND